MTMRRTFATARRVLQQLSHDPRSIVLMIVVPSVLLTIFKYVYINNAAVFNSIAPQLLGIFPFIIMFLITSVTMVRERTSGTLERLMTTPLRRGELILGYALAFGALAVLQSSVTTAVAVWPLGLTVSSVWVLLLFAMLDALLGTALGLLMSAFAQSEFQAVQFMPAIVLPQLLLCGLINPRDEMADVLRWISNLLPMTYASDAFLRAATTVGLSQQMWHDLIVLIGFLLAAVAGAAVTLRRRTA